MYTYYKHLSFLLLNIKYYLLPKLTIKKLKLNDNLIHEFHHITVIFIFNSEFKSDMHFIIKNKTYYRITNLSQTHDISNK